MTDIELASILRNKIQDSLQKRGQKRYELETVEKNIQPLLLSMQEVDNRETRGIDVSGKKEGLELFLKDHWDITDDDLVTENEKLRFALEVKRVKISIELEDIDNRIASYNRRLVLANPDMKIFGIEEYDQKNSEAYIKTITMERDLRNLIVKTLDKKFENWWNKLEPESKQRAEKAFELELSELGVPQSTLRKIDFVDFSDYEQIFNWRESKTIFFDGKDVKQWAVITKLSELRELRNTIMHARTLSDEEFTKFEAHTKALTSNASGFFGYFLNVLLINVFARLRIFLMGLERPRFTTSASKYSILACSTIQCSSSG